MSLRFEGLSTYQVSRALGVTRRTATLWAARLAHGGTITFRGSTGTLTKITRTPIGRWRFDRAEVQSVLTARCLTQAD